MLFASSNHHETQLPTAMLIPSQILVLNRRFHDSLPARITVSSVQTFSYGQADTGTIILWAGGNAGWFELAPSRTYKSIFDADCEAVKCLYFIADLYQTVKTNRRKSFKVEEVFDRYAAEPMHKCTSLAQAEEIFKRHRLFLLDCMEKGKEGVSWKTTAIYTFLQSEAEADEDAIMADGDEIPPPVTPAHDTNDPRAKHAGKGKSTLRPKSKKHKGPSNDRSSAEEEATSLSQTPTLQPKQTVPAKRKRPAQPGRSIRSRHVEAQDDDQIDMPDPEPTQSELDPIPLPLLPKARSKQSQRPRAGSPPVRFRTTAMPSYDATLPGDIWTCPFDGCTCKVYAASTGGSRQIIKDHFQLHAFDAQAQLDLVYAEERPYLPVGRLVEKIRIMAAKRDADLANGKSAAAVKNAPGRSASTAAGMAQFFPKPIERRY